MDQKASHMEWPYVSVIIPFYNNQEEVLRIEKALRKQSYQPDRFEIVFIDNGSTKPFTFSESFLEKNMLLKEEEYPNSPYSARNRGIEKSTGEIIAFVDANSIPEKAWLEEGISCLLKSNVDLVGGNVQFDFQGQITAGKIVDALTSINMERAIRERGAAYTANLFVKKKVFEEIGLFDEGVRSGGDVRWTIKAKQYGFKIFYCEAAIVKKYARSTKELYKKKTRTGRGYFHTWKQEPDGERRPWFYNFFRSLKPPSFSKIRRVNPERYSREFDKKMALVWFHTYASGIAEQIAFLSEFLRVNLNR